MQEIGHLPVANADFEVIGSGYHNNTCQGKIAESNPANIYLFNVNNRSTRKKVQDMFKVKSKNNRTAGLLVKKLKPTLNIQKKLVPLKIFN